MRPGFRIAALALLLACLAGCRHKQAKIALPPQVTAPTHPPAQLADQVPPMPPVSPATDDSPVKLDTTVPPETNTETAETPPHHTVRHHPKSAADTAAPEEAHAPAPAGPAPSPEVASGQPSGMSPIGQLSTGGDTSTSARDQITRELNSTEDTLNGIRRLLSSDEQKTAAQIRTFIVKARDALKINDLDGARNLSTKAKLLLQELTQQ